MNCVKIGRRVVQGKGIRGVSGSGLGLALLLAGPVARAELDLGPAANFTVFQMGTAAGDPGSWTSFSSDIVNGNIAFLTPSPINSPPGVIGPVTEIRGGTVQATLPSFPPGWVISGGATYTQVPASTLIAYANQARAFSAAATALGVGLPNIGDVTGETTYTLTAANLAGPGLNTYIVNINSLAMPGFANFNLDGSQLPPGARVIVNVANSFSLNGPGGIGGVGPGQVLFNYTGTSPATMTIGSDIFGTFLAPNATFNSSFGVVTGSIIAPSVVLNDTFVFPGLPFIPEPSTWIAGALLLLPFGESLLRIVRKA